MSIFPTWKDLLAVTLPYLSCDFFGSLIVAHGWWFSPILIICFKQIL